MTKEIYIATTPRGLCISNIQLDLRTTAISPTAEFWFSVLSPFGDEFFFRHQKDEKGHFYWHMHSPGNGNESSSNEACNRGALGKLPLAYTARELENLYFRVKDLPSLTHYLIIPGHDDCPNKPDFLAFPLSRNVVAFLRIFSSAANHFVDQKVIDSMQRTISDVRAFNLDEDMKKDFSGNLATELGFVNSKLLSNGYFLFQNTSAPNFIKEAMKSGQTQTQTMKLDYGNDKKGIITDNNGVPVGIIKDLSLVFAGYEIKVKSDEIINAHSREIPLDYNPRGVIKKINNEGKDLLADYMKNKTTEDLK